jgi:Mu transposase, C-terminal
MRDFIGNIIDRLRGFIYGKNSRDDRRAGRRRHDPGPRERAPGIVPGRFDTVALTPAGILFKGNRYESPALGEMLFDSRSGNRTTATIKWDPWDVSSIYVWNSTARPQPQWVTVAAAGAAAGPRLSFAHHAAVREFAKAQNLNFSTDEQRSEAHHQLRRHWEMLAGQKPLREIR